MYLWDTVKSFAKYIPQPNSPAKCVRCRPNRERFPYWGSRKPLLSTPNTFSLLVPWNIRCIFPISEIIKHLSYIWSNVVEVPEANKSRSIDLRTAKMFTIFAELGKRLCIFKYSSLLLERSSVWQFIDRYLHKNVRVNVSYFRPCLAWRFKMWAKNT